MNAKIKLSKAIFTLLCFTVLVIFSSILIISNLNQSEIANAYIVESRGVAAEISGNYYVGNNQYKMYSEGNEKICFTGIGNEVFPSLEPVEEIVLSSSNSVVFEYVIKNVDDEKSFVVTQTANIDSSNMKIEYCYSTEKLENFDNINFNKSYSVGVPKQKGYLVYLYVKATIENTNNNAFIDGELSFTLTEDDVYQLNLVDGEDSKLINVAYGFEIPKQHIKNIDGLIFKGYYTNQNGDGEQVINEFGESNSIWIYESDLTLYAYYEEI